MHIVTKAHLVITNFKTILSDLYFTRTYGAIAPKSQNTRVFLEHAKSALLTT